MSERSESGVTILLALALTPFSAVLSGWALSTAWGWFLVPTFGLPPLRIPIAIGIAAVVSFMTRDGNDKPLAENVITAFLKPLLLVAFCWIVRMFV